TPGFLDLALREMKRGGFRFVSMDELCERLGSPLPQKERVAAISLDDGYRDNLYEALPVFERHETPFILHVAPALLDGDTAPWWLVLEEIVLKSRQVSLPGNKGGQIFCRTLAEKIRADRILTRYLTQEVAEADQAEHLARLAASAGVELDG